MIIFIILYFSKEVNIAVYIGYDHPAFLLYYNRIEFLVNTLLLVKKKLYNF